MHVTRVAAIVAAGCVVLSGCAVASGSSDAARSTAPHEAALTVVPAADTGTMKPYVLGNASRSLGAISGATAALSARVNAVTVAVNWSDLEATEGTFTFSAIDSALASAGAKGLTVRLRVLAGTNAPDWAKRIGGTPIPFYDHQAGQATTIGRIWRSDYQAAWQDLMTHLAARYDGNRIVREVNIAGTGFISAEPMLTMGNDAIPGSSLTNNDRLIAAGATETARRTALMNDIYFMERTWKQTHLTLFCHPYVTLDPSPKKTLSITEDIVSAAYNADPGHIVFGHTGASSATFQGDAHDQALGMYEFFIANHYPFMAQTQAYGGGAKNEGVGDLSYVITWLAAHGAYSIELPSGWQYDSGALRVMPGTTRRMVASSTHAGTGGLSGA